MADPTGLLRLEPGALELAPSRPVLLHSLSGFLDAGGAGRLAVAQLLESLEHRIVATFDLDTLFDYRARRPRMTFISDHYEQMDLPELVVREVRDDAGTPFLLLHGPEPDFAWQRFVAAVQLLVEQFDVSRTVGMHAIPWPAPHTRPVSLTVHGTEQALLGEHQPWVGALEVPGHVAGMLELTLGRAGHPAMGFAAHVPHYLAGGEHPRSAVALLEAVSASTGLLLPLDALRAAADASDADIAQQLAASPENSEAVHALELQHDALMAGRSLPVVDTGGGDLPTGDEIAAQVEQFLAEMDPQRPDDA